MKKYLDFEGLSLFYCKTVDAIKKKIESGEISGGTDTMVTQTPTSENKVYPLLLAPDAQIDEVTGTAFFNAGVTLNPSTNTINANISGNAAGNMGVVTTGSADAYVADVPGITELKSGINFTMVPHVVNAANATLNVNGLGAKQIRRRLSNGQSVTVAVAASLLAVNKAVRVTYDGTFWIADHTQPNASDIYGTLAVNKGGTGGTTAEDARANLEVYSKEEIDAALGDISAILTTVTGVQ